MGNLKKKKKSKKKLIIILIVIIAIIGVGIYTSSKNVVEEKKPDVQKIEKRTIATTISATGTVATTTSRNVTSTLSGMNVKTVDVKEGDKVEVGDVICTLDVSSVQDNLNLAQSSQNVAKAQADIGVKSAERSLNDAISSKDTQVKNTQTEIDNAKSAYDSANSNLTNAKSALAIAEKNLNAYAQNYKSSEVSFQAVKKEYDNRKNALDTATNNYSAKQALASNAKINYDKYFDGINQLDNVGAVINPADYKNGNFATIEHETVYNEFIGAQNQLLSLEGAKNTAEANLLNYQSTYDNALSAYTPVKEKYDSLSNAVKSASEAVASCEANVSQLKSAYDATVNAQKSAVSTADSQIASLQDNLENSKLSASSANLSTEGQIKTYKDQIEDGVVRAVSSGTVTNLGVKKGDVYMGSNIATIEGTESFIIEAEIDEYDIPDIKLGMPVYIKTDATRDEELEGEVIYVASSATVSQTGVAQSSTNATYKIQISIDTPNDRLRLGMNAKISIITDMKENVVAVPYESVQERDDGTKYIEIANDEDGYDTKKVDVQTGIEGLYYTEIITDEIKEGMKVIIPETESADSMEQLLQAMGADAGV